MHEVEFFDSSISAQTTTRNVPLVKQDEKVRTNSNYEAHRDSLKSLHQPRSIPSSLGYASITELKSMLPTLSLEQKLKLLLKAVQETEVLETTLILENLPPETSIMKVMDQKEQTLIHIASFKNSPAIVETLLQYQNKISRQNIITEWLDLRNQDTFVAFHFAAYVGSVQILEVLLKYGATLTLKNVQGQNALAIAAQGDQVMAMVWLQIQGLSYTDVDAKGGTPLHWATYYGSEFSVQFLLSWIVKLPNSKKLINLQDFEGITALHLAAMTGNVRIAKKLILKGADKSIKDQSGQTAAQMAQASQFENIYQLLESSNWLYEFLNIKQSMKPVSISWGQIISFFLLYFFCIIGTIVFVYPLLFNGEYWLQGLSIATFFIGLLFYFLTWIVSPGFVKKNKDMKVLFNLLTNFEPWELCAECQIKKPKRSRHCEYCKKCVIVYDHHCPWVNNCIGAGNHGIFMCFIVSVLINLIHVLILNGYYIYMEYDQPNEYYGWFNNIYDSHKLYIVKLTIEGIIMIICALFLFPLSYLVYVQLMNLFANKTTFEKYKQDGTKQKRVGSQLSNSSTQTSENKKQEYSCNNCLLMCCYNNKNPLYQQ